MRAILDWWYISGGLVVASIFPQDVDLQSVKSENRPGADVCFVILQASSSGCTSTDALI